MNTAKIDFSIRKGPMRPVNGVGSGPLTGHFGNNHIEDFKRAGFPFSRTHDIEGYAGGNEFINIHCLFHDFEADENDPANYNFEATDLYLQAVKEAGTEVFYRLGESIENNPPRKFVKCPKDVNKWARICEHIIRHYNYGWADGFHMNIRYWEIWNEPENYQMWDGDVTTFAPLYIAASKHLKACFPELKIGGPAFIGFYPITRGKGRAFFDNSFDFAHRFMQMIHDAGAPMDFMSWHCYTDDPDEFREHMVYARQFMKQYGYGDAESICDEWQYADKWDGNEAWVRRSAMAGAMDAGVLCLMQKGDLAAGMHYDASPTILSFCSFFAPFTGKPEKPYFCFVAYNELRKCGTEVFSENDGAKLYSLAARDEEGNYAILHVNYKGEEGETRIDIKGLPEKGCAIDISIVDEEHELDSIRRDFMNASEGSLSVWTKPHTTMLIKLTANRE